MFGGDPRAHLGLPFALNQDQAHAALKKWAVRDEHVDDRVARASLVSSPRRGAQIQPAPTTASASV